MRYKRKYSKFKSNTESIGEYCIEDSGEKLDGGVNLADLPSEIEPDQAQDLRNVWFDGGYLKTRPGQREFFTLDADGLTDSDGIDNTINDNFGHVMLQCASKLYRYTFSTGKYEKLISLTIPSGETKAPKGSFFLYGYSVYFLNGIDYIRIDDSGAEHVVGYVPKVYHVTYGYDANNITLTPYEEKNMLSEYFDLSYDSYYSYTRFLVPKTLCPDLSCIKSVIIGGVEYTASSKKYTAASFSTPYFSVSLASQPTVAPHQVQIRIKRLATTEFGLPELMDKITYKYATAFGGDSRIFFCGDGTNRYRYSASYDPSYLPNSFVKPVGNGDELICFGRQYDILTMFKKYETHVLTYNYVNGQVEFEARCISPVIGCDIRGSVQTIQNRLVFANTYGGAYILVSTARENEKNVQPISRNVDKLLRSSLSDADSVRSVDFDGRYWLYAGDYTFVWDHENSPYTYSGGAVNSERKLSWYIFDNIKSGGFFTDSGKLYCVSVVSPKISVFNDVSDDFGDEIKSYWHSAEMKLGKDSDMKTIDRIWLTLPPSLRCEMNAQYSFTEVGRCVKVDEPKLIASGEGDDFLKVFEFSPSRHMARTFSVKLECKSSNAVLALCSLRVRYMTERGGN